MKTCDIEDQFSSEIQVALTVGLRHYGSNIGFSGPIQTIKCVNDNGLIKKTLGAPGYGRVLVVDGSGLMSCALMGDVIAGLAVSNAWSGVVINGCIRDSSALAKLPLGVMALGTNPKKSLKECKGTVGEPVRFAEVEFIPGHYLYADEDGLICAKRCLEAA